MPFRPPCGRRGQRRRRLDQPGDRQRRTERTRSRPVQRESRRRRLRSLLASLFRPRRAGGRAVPRSDSSGSSVWRKVVTPSTSASARGTKATVSGNGKFLERPRGPGRTPGLPHRRSSASSARDHPGSPRQSARDGRQPRPARPAFPLHDGAGEQLADIEDLDDIPRDDVRNAPLSNSPGSAASSAWLRFSRAASSDKQLSQQCQR